MTVAMLAVRESKVYGGQFCGGQLSDLLVYS